MITNKQYPTSNIQSPIPGIQPPTSNFQPVELPHHPGLMQVVIERKYFDQGTNGLLYINGSLQCNCIELPWKKNEPRVSCIPEGRYQLRKRYSVKHGDHLQVMDVPGRSCILIHPANNAQKELMGCIAPLVKITGEGRGTRSREAFKAILNKVYPPLNDGAEVWLTIAA